MKDFIFSQGYKYFVLFLIVSFLSNGVFVSAAYSNSEDQPFSFKNSVEYDPFQNYRALKSNIHAINVNKIYLAQVLLSKNKWEEARELLRHVYNSEQGLNPISKSQIKLALNVLRGKSWISPRRWWDTFLGEKRNKLREFIEVQYLLNEAMMNNRITINSSSDSETMLIGELLKSYFFPGNEKYGKIVYPNPASYSFDIYALVEENLKRLLISPSYKESDEPTVKDLKETFKVIEEHIKTQVGTILTEGADAEKPAEDKELKPEINDVDADESDEIDLDNRLRVDLDNNNLTLPEGMDLPDRKINLQDPEELIKVAGSLYKFAREVAEKYQLPDRRFNKYREQAMLLQALVDPGSMTLDPQLEKFFKGVTLEYDFGEFKSLKEKDVRDFKAHFANECVEENGGNISLNFHCMIGGSPDSAENVQRMIFNAPGNGVEGITVRVVTAIGGENLIWFRRIQEGLKLYRNVEVLQTVVRDHKVSGFVFSLFEKLSKIQKLSPLAHDANALPSLGHWTQIAVRTAARGTGKGTTALGNFLSHKYEIFRDVHFQAFLQKKFPKFIRMDKWKGWLKSSTEGGSKFKNGSALKFFVGVGVTAEIAMAVVDCLVVEDEWVRNNLLVDHAASALSQLTYLARFRGFHLGLYVAWLDVLNYAGVPFNSTDIYRGIIKGVWGLALRAQGYKSMLDKELSELDKSLGLPGAPLNYFQYVNDLSLDNVDMKRSQAIVEIYKTTNSYLTALYLGHRKINDQEGHKDFGGRIHIYMDQYEKYRQEYEKIFNEMDQLEGREHKEIAVREAFSGKPEAKTSRSVRSRSSRSRTTSSSARRQRPIREKNPVVRPDDDNGDDIIIPDDQNDTIVIPD